MLESAIGCTHKFGGISFAGQASPSCDDRVDTSTQNLDEEERPAV